MIKDLIDNGDVHIIYTRGRQMMMFDATFT